MKYILTRTGGKSFLVTKNDNDLIVVQSVTPSAGTLPSNNIPVVITVYNIGNSGDDTVEWQVIDAYNNIYGSGTSVTGTVGKRATANISVTASAYYYCHGSFYIRARTYGQTLWATSSVIDVSHVRSTDEVECSGYLPISTTGNLTLREGDPGTIRTVYLNKNNLTLIRQSGNITKAAFRVNIDVGHIGSIIIAIYRKDGTTYDRIGYQDFASQITASGTYTLSFSSPIAVQVGDYVAIAGSRGTTTGTTNIAGVTGYTSGSNKYGEYNPLPDQDFDADAATSGTFIVPIKCYIQAPYAIAIGDSIFAGHGSGTGGSLIENSLVPLITKLIGYNLYLLNNAYVMQDMGIGSQTTTQISARFAADVVAYKPLFAIIEGGVNDINTGVSKATFIANYTAMLDACVTGNIIPVVCKILPWTNGTNAQMQTRDDWMTDLEALVATYTGSVWVDFDTDMGKFRVGGDADNLWDLQTTPDYDDDGVHPTLLGYQKMAEVINREITAVYTI